VWVLVWVLFGVSESVEGGFRRGLVGVGGRRGGMGAVGVLLCASFGTLANGLRIVEGAFFLNGNCRQLLCIFFFLL